MKQDKSARHSDSFVTTIAVASNEHITLKSTSLGIVWKEDIRRVSHRPVVLSPKNALHQKVSQSNACYDPSTNPIMCYFKSYKVQTCPIHASLPPNLIDRFNGRLLIANATLCCS